MNFFTSFSDIKSWYNTPYTFLENAQKEKGDTFYLSLPGMGRTLVTGNETLLNEIQMNRHLIGGRGSQFLHHIVGKSVITLEGNSHSEVRKKLNPIFFQPDRATIETISQSWALSTIKQIRPNENFSVADWTNIITLKTIITFLLDDLDTSIQNDLFTLVEEWKKSLTVSAFFFLKPLQINFSNRYGWGKYLFHRNKIHQALLSIIRTKTKNNGLISKMIYDFDWDENQILNETISVLMFGHDTSAILLAWWVRHLLTFHHWDKNFTDEQIESSLKEAARITPPVVHLTRVATQTTQIGPYTIKENEKVFPCIYLAHMNEKVFQRPHEFQIERFINNQHSNSHYFPFGFGDRICLGKIFAEIQTKTIAKIMLEHLNLKLVGQDNDPIRQFFLIVPKNGTLVRNC